VRIALIALVLAVAACAALPSHSLSAKEVQAVNSAEAFILRNGYTVTGHPEGLPVQNVEVLDPIATPEQLIEWRRNTLENHAFGVTPCMCGTDAYYVFFHKIDHANGFRGVLVQNDEAIQVVHSVLILDAWPWRAVPPNKSLERTRER
jgi:hypothetical protein